jgi:hypothetical protein
MLMGQSPSARIAGRGARAIRMDEATDPARIVETLSMVR